MKSSKETKDPLGAAGGRFYFLGERSRRRQWYTVQGGKVLLSDGKHTVGPFDPEQVISEHEEGVAEFGEEHYGYATQELLNWLDEMGAR